MKKFLGACLFALVLAAPASNAQPANPDDYQFVPSGEQKLIPDKSGLYSLAMLAQHKNSIALVTVRTKSGIAESHANWVDYIFVQEGTADLILGGTMDKPKEVGPGETRGPSITGGKKMTMHAGDYIYVPAKMAHQMILLPGKTIRYGVVKTHP